MRSNKLKVFIGIVISLIFLLLAFRKVDFAQMAQAFSAANYWFVLLAVGVIVSSHWLRALRWHYLLKPIHSIETAPLFNALIIGYMFNVFLPAHLGEFVRAYVLGRKKPVASSAVFGTIVIERIIDVFTLLFIMAVTIVVFPFPDWVRTSGYISFGFIALLFLILIVMKKFREQGLRILNIITRPLPEGVNEKITRLISSFLDGIVPLQHWSDYGFVIILSLIMWAAYALVFQLTFYAFDFVHVYSLPWFSVLVLLVITTISILVPSSPGYVGTYHYLCQLSLGLFAVPKSPALSYAVIMHGLNFLPVLILGLVFLSLEGLNIKSLQASVQVQKAQ